MSSPIFLVGMPGAGKTHWGRVWAETYDRKFTDLDALVEVMEEATIPEIFETRGERGFRDAEQRALTYLLERVDGNSLIACGGGTPAFDDNMACMLRAGLVVYLHASVERLAQQLIESPKARPLVAAGRDVASLVPFIEKVLAMRRPFYEQAQVTLEVEALTEATFAEILSTCTSRP
jgi:shikimate kinase